MKLAWWMLSGAIVFALLLTVVLGTGAGLEIWLGMPGPLAAAIVSWMAMRRQYIKRPEALTRLMAKSFAMKMIFFAIYITVFLKIGLARPNAFVISFIGAFILLHGMEAVGLHRLQASALSVPRQDFQKQLGNG
jgi:hypothetical protein